MLCQLSYSRVTAILFADALPSRIRIGTWTFGFSPLALSIARERQPAARRGGAARAHVPLERFTCVVTARSPRWTI